MKSSKEILKIVVLVIGIVLRVSASVIGQNNNNLSVDFKVTGQESSLIKRATVTVFNETGEVINTFKRPNYKGSTYRIFMDFDEINSIKVTKNGFDSKTLLFNTKNVPVQHQEWGFEYGGFSVVLIPTTHPASNDTVGRVFYDPAIENFIHNK